jgi:hypothetical protein
MEETLMPKSTKQPCDARPPADTQKLYAHAYAARLAKQVGDDGSRRKPTGRKKRGGKD